MPLYSCKYCNFSTTLKSNYTRHLKTKKHILRINIYKEHGVINDETRNEYLMTQNDPKMTQNDPKKTQNDPKKFECKYCFRKFSTKAHKRRHELHRCKSDKNIDYELKLERMRKQFEKEKDKLYNQIDKLIDKAGDTNTTINNIQLNNFGEEDTSYISDKVLKKLITYPGSMIPNLLKLTHFHKDHPENKNLQITNKKDKYIKIYKNDEWKLDKRDKVIDNIMNNKFDTLETYYVEKGKNSIKSYEKKRFEKIQDDIDNDDKEIVEQIKDEIELTIMNNS